LGLRLRQHYSRSPDLPYRLCRLLHTGVASKVQLSVRNDISGMPWWSVLSVKNGNVRLCLARSQFIPECVLQRVNAVCVGPVTGLLDHRVMKVACNFSILEIIAFSQLWLCRAVPQRMWYRNLAACPGEDMQCNWIVCSIM
jgi:hypothetical protein